jgi:hypothetical protein
MEDRGKISGGTLLFKRGEIIALPPFLNQGVREGQIASSG